MAAADLLVSDVSSVLVEFMALDRPVIAVNNPGQQEYEGYVPTDIEYQVRDACLQVRTMDELKAAVQRAFAAPGELSEKRRRYADSLCYGRDGKSGQRAAEAVVQLLQDSFAVLKPRERFITVLTADDEIPAEITEQTVQAVLKGNAGLDITFVNRCGLPPFEHTTIDPSGSFLVFLRPGVALPPRWLEFMANYFRWYADTGMVRSLSVDDNYQSLINTIFPELPHPEPSHVSSLLLATLMGRDMPMTQVVPDCIMVKGDLIGADLSVPSNHSVSAYLTGLAERLSASGHAIRLALDIFSYPIPPSTPDCMGLPELIQSYLADPLNREKARGLVAELRHESLLQDALNVCTSYLQVYPGDQEFLQLAASIDAQLVE
jgi:hypothetical protein